MKRRGFLKILGTLIGAAALPLPLPRLRLPIPPPAPAPIIPPAVPGDFAKWIFPIIANMSQVSAMDQLVSVQPMNVPSGHVFYTEIRESWWDRLKRKLRTTI